MATDAQAFVIVMRQFGGLTSITVKADDTTNGATTNYAFEVIPGLDINYGDVLHITFPPEVLIPSSLYVQCTGTSMVPVNSCLKSDDREIRITLGAISSRYDTRDPFTVTIYNIANPVSFKPSAPFSGIRLVSRLGNDIAIY